MSTTKGFVDGLWRGERKCIDPKAGDADLWVKICEELHVLRSQENWVEVERVKAHRTKKDEEETSQFEKFVTDGNEKADELAKAEVLCWTTDLWRERERKQSSRSEKRWCMRPCSTQRAFAVWKDCEELKPKPKEKLIFV